MGSLIISPIHDFSFLLVPPAMIMGLGGPVFLREVPRHIDRTQLAAAPNYLKRAFFAKSWPSLSQNSVTRIEK